MKTRTIIIALLAVVFAKNVYAQQEKLYEISYDKTTITVSGDCTINVEEFAPEGVNVYGNLEKGGVGTSNKVKSDLFKTRTENLNQNSPHNGVDFQKNSLDDQGHAQICITYSELEDCTLTFYCAKSEIKTNKNRVNYTDWSPDTQKIFTVAITKKINEEKGNNITVTASQEGNIVNTEQNGTTNVSTLSNKENDSPQSKTMFYVLVILTFVLLLIIAYLIVSYVMLNKRHKELKKSYKQLNSTMQNVQSNGRNVQTSDKALKDFIETQFATINSNLNGLNKEFQGLKGQMSTLQSVLSNPAQTNPAQTFTPHEKSASNFIDTEIVNYLPESNSFKIGGINDGIFRIYSKDGVYYYTIVNNDNIRREIIGALPSFEKCISIQPSQGGGSMLVPVIDGKLIKDGDSYLVDSNHKLIVQWK